MSDDVTAVIVNWRTAAHATCAATALVADGVAPARVVIVDNGSDDGSAARLSAALPGCQLLALADNLGFARAVNLATRRFPARRCYLIVNSDAFVHLPGTVAALQRALARDGVGVAVPRLLGPDLTLQRSVVPFLRPASALVRASGLSRALPDRCQPALGAWWSHGGDRVVQSATGAVLAVRAPVWTALGGFDERRAFYVEDHDLLRRARRDGWRTRFVADAEFVHLGGAAANQRFTECQRARRIARAEADMLRDHLGTVARATTLGLLAGGAGGRALVHALAGDPAAADVQRAWLRGYLEGVLRRRPESHRRRLR